MVFPENSQNLQENTCARVSFLIKLQRIRSSMLFPITKFCEFRSNLWNSRNFISEISNIFNVFYCGNLKLRVCVETGMSCFSSCANFDCLLLQITGKHLSWGLFILLFKDFLQNVPSSGQWLNVTSKMHPDVNAFFSFDI